MLDTIFMQMLDMTKTASIVIGIILIARLLLKRAPKVISYMLWAVVLFRLLCPVAIEAPISLIPQTSSISDSYTLQGESISVLGAGEAAYQAVGDAINGGLGTQHIRTTGQDEYSNTRYVTSMWWEVWILIGQYVWIAGIAIMIGFNMVSYCKLKRKLIGAVSLKDNIYLSDYISFPFVTGLFYPKIYLPSMISEEEQEYIILHEQHHIRRFDPLTKFLSFLALCIHWFNPLVWLAFVLSSKDMEMSCDEAVVKKMGTEIRADYSASLLNFATGRRVIGCSLLAFGEGNTKGRIKNLANWRKPALGVVSVALIICAVLVVCLMTNQAAPYDALRLTEVKLTGGSHFANFEADLKNKIGKVTLVAEQWKDGECVQSAPINMSQFAERISLYMDIRYEEEHPIGIEIQMETNQYGGSLFTYFAFPEDSSIGGWSFTSYNEGEEIKVTPSDNKILAAMAFDEGQGIRVFDCEMLVSEPDRLKSAGYMIVIRAIFSDEELIHQEEVPTSEPIQILQPNDVAILSQEDQLEIAIRTAILEQNKKNYTSSMVQVESHKILATESGGPADSNTVDTLTVYALVLSEAYVPLVYPDGLKSEGGSYIPTALTFSVDENGKYVLTEYWIPRDGSYYLIDIKDKFPEAAVEEILNADDPIEELVRECKEKAMAQINALGDLDAEINELLESICGSRVSALISTLESEDYIGEHQEEFKQLLAYGKFTMQYCFEGFLQRDQTDAYEQLMAIVCQEIAKNLGEELTIDSASFATGEEWFNAFKDNAYSLAEQYSDAELEKYYPASWLLLQMIDE